MKVGAYWKRQMVLPTYRYYDGKALFAYWLMGAATGLAFGLLYSVVTH